MNAGACRLMGQALRLCPFKSVATVIRAVPGQQRHTVADWGVAGPLPFFPLLVSPAHSMLPLSFCCQGLQLTFISLSFHLTHASLSERWALLTPASSEQCWARGRAQS